MAPTNRVDVVQRIDDTTFKSIATHKSTKDAYNDIASGRHGDGPFDVVTFNAQGARLRDPKRVPKRVLDLGDRPTRGRKPGSGKSSGGKDPKPKPAA